MNAVQLKDLPESVQLLAGQVLTDQIKSMVPPFAEDCEPALKLARSIAVVFTELYRPPVSVSTQSGNDR